MNQGLTTRGEQVLILQRLMVDLHGAPASVTILSRELELNRQQVSLLCRQLVERGYMEQRPGSSLYWPTKGDSNED